MSPEESRKNSFSVFIISTFLLLISIYYYYYPFFILLKLRSELTHSIFLYIKEIELFPEFYFFISFISIAYVIAAIMYFPKRNVDATYKQAAYTLCISILLLIISGYCQIKEIFIYSIISLICYLIGLYLIVTGTFEYRKVIPNFKKEIEDPHNDEAETFLQIEQKIENEYSVNIPTKYRYDGEEKKGWLNLINLFRGLMVIGTPGSGKSFAIIEEIMFQLLAKFFTMVVYDFKFSTLTKIVYNYLEILKEKYKDDPKKLARIPKFYILNFDDIAYTNRANPIDPYLMVKQSDATNAATTIMLNLNKDWIKQKNFFAKSAISYVSGMNWYMKLMSEKYGKNICTLPHVIMLSTVNLDILLDILMDSMEVRQLLIPFKEALEREAQEQLAGQTASAQISLSQIATKEIFYVMSESDFTLDINNPNRPKVVCIGNNPNRKEIYAAPIGLYLSKILQVINQPNKLPVGVVIDELPTTFINGLDEYISTARSNLGATILGIQSISQMIKDYGKEVSDVIYDICANIVSGSAKGVTADYVSKIFGKNKQKKQSHNVSKNDTSTNISTQLGDLLPISKLAALSQGTFTGVVADTFDQRIKQKLFHAEIVADIELKKNQNKRKLPIIRDFKYKNYDNDVANKFEEFKALNYFKLIIDIDFECSNYIQFYNKVLPEYASKVYLNKKDQEAFIENSKWIKIFDRINTIEGYIMESKLEYNTINYNSIAKKIEKFLYQEIEIKFIELEKQVILDENYIRIIKDVDTLVKEEYFRIKGEYPEFSIFDENKLSDELKEVITEITPEQEILNSLNEKIKKRTSFSDRLSKINTEDPGNSDSKNKSVEEQIFSSNRIENPNVLQDTEHISEEELNQEY